jgi:hypothetical protein
LAHRFEDGAELVADFCPQPVPSLPIRGRGVGQAVQQAGFAHEGLRDLEGLRDGGQFLVEHAGEGEQIIALVAQRDAHRADAPRILWLETLQFIGRPSRTWGVNKNRTNTWRSEWDGRGGPDGQKQEAAASCSPPGFGRSHVYQRGRFVSSRHPRFGRRDWPKLEGRLRVLKGQSSWWRTAGMR